MLLTMCNQFYRRISNFTIQFSAFILYFLYMPSNSWLLKKEYGPAIHELIHMPGVHEAQTRIKKLI